MNPINLPKNYYGISSFDMISTSSQKKKNASLSAIYSAASQTAELKGLTSAIGSLRSAAAGAGTQKERDAASEQINKITTAMKNSFQLSGSSNTFTPADTRSIQEQAKDAAEEMLKKYQSGTKIDELI